MFLEIKFFGGWRLSFVFCMLSYKIQFLGEYKSHIVSLCFGPFLTSDHNNTEYFNNEDQIVCVQNCKISTASTIQKHVQQVLFALVWEPQSWYFLCLKYPIIGGISTLRFFLDLVIAKSVNPWIAFNTEIFFSCRIKNLRPKVVVVTLLISILALAGIIEWLRWLWWKRNKRGSSHRRRDETRIKTNICSVFVDIFICLDCVVEQKIKSDLRALKYKQLIQSIRVAEQSEMNLMFSTKCHFLEIEMVGWTKWQWHCPQ